MSLKDFLPLVKSEKSAYNFLKKHCWKNYNKFCTRCKRFKPYILSEGRYRCKRCKYTFNDFSGRFISKVKIPAKTWLWIIKLFEFEMSTRKIAKEVEISYNTALKAVDSIRLSILCNATDVIAKGEVELDEAYFGGRRKGNRGRGAFNKVPVFGILERKGKVSVIPVKNVTAETLLTETVKKVKRGSLVYTDKWKSYDSLMFCGYRHLRVDHSRYFSRGKVYINGIEGFWSFAKERLIKFHGVSKEKFPLYLKEMEFRYNNRHKNIFPLLVKYVTNLVPKLT